MAARLRGAGDLADLYDLTGMALPNQRRPLTAYPVISCAMRRLALTNLAGR